MSRYERMKEFSECQLGNTCPISMQKGAILKDTITDKYYLQLKLLNKSKNVIQNVYLKLQCTDLKHSEEHEINVTYLKLNCTGNNYFGTQTLIALPQIINNIKFNKILVEYQNGEKKKFDLACLIKMSQLKSKKRFEYLPVVAAVALLIGDVLRFINSFGDMGIEQCITLALIIALLFRKKNVGLALTIGIRAAYDIFMLICNFWYYSKLSEYDINIPVYSIIGEIIYRSSYIILLVLLIVTLVASSAKVMNINKRLWALPGILYLVSLSILQMNYITIYIYSILQNGIITFALFLMGYWITHEAKK